MTREDPAHGDSASLAALAESPDDAVPATAAARAVFGETLYLAERYARLLAGDGVAHGHLGPREVPRLWNRHLINSALLADLLPERASVVDVGSGAGLPGIPMAIRRADLHVTLLEPMARRVTFLSRAVATLELPERLTVVRGRAEEAGVHRSIGTSQWVVARAVAPLDRLVGWCLPLLASQGQLLALKGASVADEVAQHSASIKALGARVVRVVELSGDGDSTFVAVIEKTDPALRRSRAGSTRRKGSR